MYPKKGKKFRNITSIIIQALTEDKKEEEKEYFYIQKQHR